MWYRKKLLSRQNFLRNFLWNLAKTLHNVSKIPKHVYFFVVMWYVGNFDITSFKTLAFNSTGVQRDVGAICAFPNSSIIVIQT